MKYTKKNFPVSDARKHLEPGPIVLLSSEAHGKHDIMTMGWHMIIEFEPSLLACYIWDANYSYKLVRESHECVINVPTFDLIEKVVGIGNCSGKHLDKFKKFGLTMEKGSKVRAPMIKECYANFECRLVDDSLIDKNGIFIFEIVKAHVDTSIKNPRTVHYRGHGEFMIAGDSVNMSDLFKPEMLQ